MTVRHILSILFTCLLLVPAGGCGGKHKAGGGSAAAPAKQLPPPLSREAILGMQFPAMRDFQPRAADARQLSNGTPVFLLEDHDLPLVTMRIIVRAGSILDPAGKVGLADFTGTVLRTGGTTSMTPDQFNLALEERAASIEVSTDLDTMQISLSCLSRDFPAVYGILADMLAHPEFREDQLKLARNQAMSGIQWRNQDPSDIAGRELDFLLYGPDSAYAREMLPWHVQAIQRDDLRGFFASHIHPGNFIIGILGDFETQTAMDLLNRTIPTLPSPATPAMAMTYPAVNTALPRVMAVADKPDLTQTSVAMAVHCNVDRLHPDYCPLVVAVGVLGSNGFSSRLMKEVRRRAGYAYSVGAGLRANYNYPATLSVELMTKTESTADAIRLSLNIIREMTEQKISDEELKSSKDSILNSFVFDFAEPANNLARPMRYLLRGMPQDYVQRFQKNIEATTTDDVLRVAKAYFRPEAMTILAVGNAAAFREQVAEFGIVKNVDIALPQPPAGASASPALGKDALLQGATVVKQWLETMDATTLNTLAGEKYTASLNVAIPGGAMSMDMDAVRTADCRVAATVTMSGQTMRQVIDKDTAWMLTPQGKMDMPKEQADAERKSNQFSYPSALLRGLAGKSLEAAFTGAQKVNDKETTVLRIEKDGLTAELFLDCQTWQLLQMNVKTPMGVETSLYSDYRIVGGIPVPHQVHVTTVEGQELDVTVSAWEFVSKIDEAWFSAEGAGK